MQREDINPALQHPTSTYREPHVVRPEHSENTITRVIEQQAAKIPSDVFLAISLGAMATSLFFEVRNNQRVSRFLGMWVAPLLVMGVYNKLVKVLGPS